MQYFKLDLNFNCSYFNINYGQILKCSRYKQNICENLWIEANIREIYSVSNPNKKLYDVKLLLYVIPVQMR